MLVRHGHGLQPCIGIERLPVTVYNGHIAPAHNHCLYPTFPFHLPAVTQHQEDIRMYSFRNDYGEGAHPAILQAMHGYEPFPGGWLR